MVNALLGVCGSAGDADTALQLHRCVILGASGQPCLSRQTLAAVPFNAGPPRLPPFPSLSYPPCRTSSLFPPNCLAPTGTWCSGWGSSPTKSPSTASWRPAGGRGDGRTGSGAGGGVRLLSWRRAGVAGQSEHYGLMWLPCSNPEFSARAVFHAASTRLCCTLRYFVALVDQFGAHRNVMSLEFADPVAAGAFGL